MRKLLFITLAAIALAACSKGNEPGSKAIEVQNGQTDQVVWADDTEGKGGVTFKTTGAWTSTITETATGKASSAMSSRAGAPDWVAIDPSSGDAAGTYTVNITLGANHTGEDRKATITINCGNDKISITITQEGKTGSGATPGLISGIVRTGGSGKVTFLFNYDEKGRIAEYIIEDSTTPGDEYEPLSLYFSYNIAGEVRMKSDPSATEWDRIAYLNSQGYATKIKDFGYMESEHDLVYSNGCISEEKWKEYDNTTAVNYYTWKDGNFSESWYNTQEWSYEEMENITVPKTLGGPYTYTNITNDKTNIDLNMLLQTFGGRNGSCNGERYGSDTYNRDCLDVLSLFGFTGKRSACLVKELPEVQEPHSGTEGFSSGNRSRSSENYATPVVEYTLDGSNNITKFVYRVDFGPGSEYSTTDTYTISYK